MPGRLAVCQLPAGAAVPEWALNGEFFSVTRTPEEISIVCADNLVPDSVRAEQDWVALKLEGPFPFSTTGVLASFINPLAGRNIPVFAIATFDTDYVLIKRENLDPALQALAEEGHELLG